MKLHSCDISFLACSHGNADQGPALTMADLSSEERTTQQVGPLTGGTPMRKLASQSSSDTSNNLNDPCAAFDSAARSSLVSSCSDTIHNLGRYCG